MELEFIGIFLINSSLNNKDIIINFMSGDNCQLLSVLSDHCDSISELLHAKLGQDIGLSSVCKIIETSPFEIILVVIATVIAVIIAIVLSKKKRGQSSFMATLSQIKEITHDTKIFTFELPSGMNKVGLNIGQHLELEAEVDGKVVARKYTPVSRADLKRNSFDLLIKVYFPLVPQFPNGGIMSQYVNNLKIGDKIKVTLPFGRFNYLGNSNVQITQTTGKVRKQKVDHIFMVGGGTGITPLYQIIQYTSEAQVPSVRPKLSLLFANRTEDDILLKTELDTFQKQNEKFRCLYSVDRSVKQGWSGLVGFVDEAKISKLVGEGNFQNSLFVVCGPPVLCNILEKILKSKYNIKDSQFFRF